MSDPVVALVMLGLFICFIFLGFPIAFTLMAMAVGFGFFAYYNPLVAVWDNNIFYLLVQNTYSVMSNDVLISIPLFLFMGYIIERSNILERLFESLQIALEKFDGTLIFVSHDREFVSALANRILEVKMDGTVTDYSGTYEEYLRSQALEG